MNNFQKSKEKGFVLPSTIVAIVILSLVSFLMVTLITTTTTSNRFLVNFSNKKILCEKIFNDFKNDKLTDYENILVETYTNTENENICAIVAKKDDKAMFFGIYDFSKNEVICYQISKFDFEIEENTNLIFGELIFSKDEIGELI